LARYATRCKRRRLFSAGLDDPLEAGPVGLLGRRKLIICALWMDVGTLGRSGRRIPPDLVAEPATSFM